MHVVFVEPSFPPNQRQHVRALKAVGARVTGIGETPREHLDDEVQRNLDGYEHVHSVVDEGALEHAVRTVQAREWVDRLEATVEAHILPAAHVRERTRIPGTSARTAYLCRDKPSMKEVLRRADVPCPASTGASSADEVRQFARSVGYPLIVKPRDGAGAAGAQRADDDASLERAIEASGVDRGTSCAVEEFVEGHEGFYDTICVDGRVVHEFVGHYYPVVLEAMRTRWISPYFVSTNRVEADSYRELRELGRRVVRELGIGTSASHMEWFFGPKGLRFSEIGCRPPGVHVWDLHSAGNDLDLYVEWAHAIVHGRSPGHASRARSAGMIAFRPDRDGTISHHEGLEEYLREFGAHVIDLHFPSPGTPTQPVEAGYRANAWMRMQHPDYDELRRMLDLAGERIRLKAR